MKLSISDSMNPEEIRNPQLREEIGPLISYVNSLAIDLSRLARNQINRQDNLQTVIKTFPAVHGVAKTIQINAPAIGSIGLRVDHPTDFIVGYQFKQLAEPGQVQMTVYFNEASTESRSVTFEFPGA